MRSFIHVRFSVLPIFQNPNQSKGVLDQQENLVISPPSQDSAGGGLRGSGLQEVVYIDYIIPSSRLHRAGDHANFYLPRICATRYIYIYIYHYNYYFKFKIVFNMLNEIIYVEQNYNTVICIK